jgi:hypothetical protein
MEPECSKLHNVQSISLGCCPTRESILATDTPVFIIGSFFVAWQP